MFTLTMSIDPSDVCFIIKARTIILFTNMTLKRLGFGGTSFYGGAFSISKQYDGGHMSVHNPATQHAAKLQLSVRPQKPYTFPEDMSARL